VHAFEAAATKMFVHQHVFDALVEVMKTIVARISIPHQHVVVFVAGTPGFKAGRSFMHYYRNASLHCLVHLARKSLNDHRNGETSCSACMQQRW